MTYAIARATEGDLSFIRSCWMQDVRAWYGPRQPEEYDEHEPRIRDALLDQLGAYVVRPLGEGVPEDTIGAFMVADLGAREAVVHWLGTKRAWRGQGFAAALLEFAEQGRSVRFTRHGGPAQLAGLVARGWRYVPHLAWGGMELVRCA